MSNTNRRKRLSLLAASALMVVGLAATFAATTDSTDTGTLEVQSGEVATGIDVRIADIEDGVADGTDCSTLDDSQFVQDMTVDLLLATDQTPESPVEHSNVCLRSFGAEDADLEAFTIFDLASTELGCTFDEEVDDPDGAGCGTDGELDGKVMMAASRIDDAVGTPNVCPSGQVDEYGRAGHANTTPLADGESIDVTNGDFITAGTDFCVQLSVDYHDGSGSAPAFTPAELNAAQSDSLSWKVEISTAQSA